MTPPRRPTRQELLDALEPFAAFPFERWLAKHFQEQAPHIPKSLDAKGPDGEMRGIYVRDFQRAASVMKKARR